MMYGYGNMISPSNRLFSGGGGANPLWNGLQAYYTADNTPNDALGTYNGTLVNGATYGTGIINNGFSLDGVNDYVDMGNNLDFDGSTPFSISFWLNANAIGGTSKTPLSKAYNIAPFNGYFFVISAAGNMYFYLSNDLNSPNYIAIENSATLSTSTWYHVVATYDGSKDSSGLKVYVDNALNTQNVISNTLTGSISNSKNFRVGARDNGQFYDGLVDEVAVFNKELSSSEVTELYNAGAAKQYPTGINVLWSDLLAYYTADNTPNDALGNFNGTLTNGATYGTGIISNGFSLDGVNDTVDFGNNLDFDGSTPFSISCWIKPNNVTSSNVPLAKAQNLAPFTGYWFLITSTGNLRFILSNDVNSPNYLAIENNLSLSTSTWYHCVMTYDGSKSSTGLKVYVDNALNTQTVIGNTLTGSTSNSINFKLGARNNGFFYNGLIDEVAVFNKELSASEVTELYNAGAGKQYPN